MLHPDRDGHRGGAHEAGQRLVDGVARVGHEDLVARVDQAEDGVQHHALAADRDEDLLRIGGHALAQVHVGGDGLAQGGDARERRVVGGALVEGLLGRLAHVGRRIEVRLADLEVDDRSALGLERPGAGADLEGALGADGAHAGGRAQTRAGGHGDPPQGSNERMAKVTLAGRSASRRMYHGYQCSP